MRHVVAIDFETASIEGRPAFPPEAVGVALRYPDGDSRYLAWGHPVGNNVTPAQAKETLYALFSAACVGEIDLLFHNAKFDLAVSCEGMGLPMPPWRNIHDTMFLIFLADPNRRSLGLKEVADDLLGMPPEEQDAVADWVWQNRADLVASYGGKITRAKRGPNSAGAWISRCPAHLVAPYAIGDVERTFALFEHLHPLVRRVGMGVAYDRERRLLPILMENERQGMRVDLQLLEHDIAACRAAMGRVERWVRRELDAPALNLDADRDFADALLMARAVDETRLVMTPSGQISVSKDNLTSDMFLDPRVGQAVGYRNRLKTTLTMFMEPWLAQASARGGVISTNWNQVSGEGGGTRTGRPSTSNPNFLNISKSFEDRGDGYSHPEFLGVPRLPEVRRYILPDEGHVFQHRDFDGQELRVFAHYESGDLLRAYLKDASTDPHAFVGARIAPIAFGREYDGRRDRALTKVLNFQALYGGGAPAAAKKLGCSLQEAKQFKAFHDRALPGRKLLNEAIASVIRGGDAIRTWGGRVYYPEPPRVINGQRRDLMYRMINTLVQGSAADITKEAVCRWHEGGPDSRFLVTVYDEINISSPQDRALEEMAFLRETMENFELDCPMRSSGKRGPDWGSLEKCEVGD